MVTLLDCTLRDGGYYTQWDFDPELVHSYLHAMEASSIEFVEVGMRGSRVSGFAGAHAYTSDAYIESLNAPKSLRLGVMVNAADLLVDEVGGRDRVAELFRRTSESPLSFVRIACHAHEVEPVMPAARELKALGYIVCVNLMQITGRTDEDISKLAGVVDAAAVDVLYFADSLGSLSPKRVAEIASLLRKNWKGKLGIHAHDNMGRALANSVVAADNSVAWLDCTVSGMGRGPGNAATEYMVLELADRREHQGHHLPLLETIRKYFQPLKDKHRWGMNPFYYLAGQYGIHPTFVQQMLIDSRFQESELLSVVEQFRETGASKFSVSALETGRRRYAEEVHGDWKPAQALEGKDVLILGAGPSLGRHKEAVEAAIKKLRPVVLGLNVEQKIDESLVDYRVACHPLRLLADWRKYSALSSPLILPIKQQSPDFQDTVRDLECLDFGLQVAENEFAIHDDWVKAPTPLVAAYALGIAASGKARRVLLAGFDGFPSDDPRQKEMLDTLLLFREAVPNLEVVSVTPSRYELSTQSVYELCL